MSKLLFPIQIVLLGLMLFLLDIEQVGWVSGSMKALGVLLALASANAMAFRFNVFPDLLDGTQLVSTGPYAVIRHPMYSALATIGLGWLWASPGIAMLILWTLLVSVLALKAEIEEENLKKAFPDFANYQKMSKRFIPFIL